VWLWAIAAAVTGLAFWLRVHELGRESLWLDEGFTYERSSLPLPQLIEHAIRGHHNPTYFILIHYWLGFGDDEFMLRLPSAIAGALAAGASVCLGYVLHSVSAGMVAGVLVAIAPLQIAFGQEARMYSLLCLTATLAMTALIWLGRHPESAARPILGTARLWRRSDRQAAHEDDRSHVATGGEGADATLHPRSAAWAWTTYTLSMALSLYLHNTVVLFGLTALLALLVLCWEAGRAWPRVLANFVAVNVLVLGVFGFYLRTELQQAQVFADSSFFATFPRRNELINSARELYLLTAKPLTPVAGLLYTGTLLGLWELRERPRIAAAILCFSFVGPGLMLLVSLYKPIFGTRLLLWSAPPFFALVGAGVAGRRPWGWSLGYVLVLAGLMVPTLRQQYAELTKEPWREVTKTIDARVQPGAWVIAASHEESLMLAYYRQRRVEPLGRFVVVEAPRHRMRKLGGEGNQVFLVDRKKGRRLLRLRQQLGASARMVREQRFRNLVLVEFAR